jgi:predicted glutamine amidotransferase
MAVHAQRFLGNWNRWRRHVEALIPDELYPSRIGTTDSEAIFLAILGAGMEDPITATEKILAKLTDIVSRSDTKDRFRFTAALTDGRDLYAFRYSNNDQANTLYYREAGGGIVIVSEPFDYDENWLTVPEDHVVVAKTGERARIAPLLEDHWQAAE